MKFLTSIMDKLYSRELIHAPRNVMRLFLLFYLIYPLIYLMILSYTIGLSNLLEVFRYVIIFCIIIIPPATAAFIIINKRLKKYILLIMSNDEGIDRDGIERFINKYPLYASITIFTGFILGTASVIMTAYAMDVIYSREQMVFLLILGEVPAVAIGFFLYYYAKITLYPATRYMNYRPLTIYAKIAIPLVFSIILIINMFNIAIYKIIEESVYEKNSALIQEIMGRNIDFIDSLKGKLYHEAESLCNADRDGKKSLLECPRCLEKMHGQKDELVDFYFVSDRNGRTITSDSGRLDLASLDLAGKQAPGNRVAVRPGFPVKGEIMTMAWVSMKSCGNPDFFAGAAVRQSRINDLILERNEKGMRFMMLSRTGEVIFHWDRKEIGNSALRETLQIRDRIMAAGGESRAGSPAEMIIDKHRFFAFGKKADALDGAFLYFRDREDFLAALDGFLVKLTLYLLFVTFISNIIGIVFSRQISMPIKKSIEVFKQVSTGDLTAEVNDYIPDEFGEFIRHLKYLLDKLNETIEYIMTLSQHLDEASVELAKTSGILSDNAREQAASIEESTAALEETLSSIESVAGHAQDQHAATGKAYGSMEKLQSRISEISHFADEALANARSSSVEASTGNDLMGKTIEGMNNIDNSTKKISEFVSMISEISDKVNLLALNAAIEAARAGDHGRGFAVVADEIGKLADQTTGGAHNISELIKTGLEEVRMGKEFVDRTSRVLSNILDNIRLTHDLVGRMATLSDEQSRESDTALTDTRMVMQMSESISMATREQNTANKEIVTTISRINEATQTISAGSHEIAVFAREMRSKIEVLNRLTHFFKIHGKAGEGSA